MFAAFKVSNIIKIFFFQKLIKVKWSFKQSFSMKKILNLTKRICPKYQL